MPRHRHDLGDARTHDSGSEHTDPQFAHVDHEATLTLRRQASGVRGSLASVPP
jgi:hypothetical protein